MSEQPLKTSDANVLPSRKKLKKTLGGEGHPPPPPPHPPTKLCFQHERRERELGRYIYIYIYIYNSFFPVEAPKFFGLICSCLIAIITVTIISLYKILFQQFTSSLFYKTHIVMKNVHRGQSCSCKTTDCKPLC